MATPKNGSAGSEGRWRRLAVLLGVDRAIGFSLLNAVRSMVGGPLIALLITLHFSPEVQGFYYTFASVVALQVLAEMGLGTVLLQFASHEWAGLTQEPHRVTGRPDNLSRLGDLVRLAARWYGGAAALSTVGLMAGGYWFFGRQGSADVAWLWPWLFLCGLAGLKLFLSPFLSILEGCGRLQQVYGYRLVEGLLALAVGAGAICIGAGLWTAGAVALAGVAAAAVLLARAYRPFFRAVLSAGGAARLDWRREMLPMQWRMAVSWISGYFVFQFFTPVLFHYQGAVTAGQFGLTWAMVSAISGVASAWINTRVPQFGVLIAHRDYQTLDRVARRAALGAAAVALVGGGAALAVLQGLHVWYPEIARRFLPVLPCGVLLGAGALMQLSLAQSAYLRAHKREPFLGLSVAGAVLIGASTWYFGSRHGATEMAWAYFGVIAAFSLPVGTLIFLRCRRRWHAAAPA